MGLLSHHLGVGDFEEDTPNYEPMSVSIYQVYWTLDDGSDDVLLGTYTTEEKSTSLY